MSQTGTLSHIDSLRNTTDSIGLHKIIHILNGSKDQLEYVFSRLIAGLSADSNITKRNFSTALLFLSSENPDILSLKLWKKISNQKLNLDEIEYSDGKRIYKNVCYGKVLSLSLQAQLFNDSLDWKVWQKSCLEILKKEPSTKALILELFHRNSEKFESFPLTEETNPVDVAYALRAKDKAFIKKSFWLKDFRYEPGKSKGIGFGLTGQMLCGHLSNTEASAHTRTSSAKK